MHQAHPRLERVVAEYLLGRGHFESAEKLCVEADLAGLVDIEVYRRVQSVVEHIRGGNCSVALTWSEGGVRGYRVIHFISFHFNRRPEEGGLV